MRYDIYIYIYIYIYVIRQLKVKFELQDVGCEDMDWIGVAQDRDRPWAIVNAVMNLRVP